MPVWSSPLLALRSPTGRLILSQHLSVICACRPMVALILSRWVDYDSASSGLIESAFMAGSPSVVVSSAHGGRAGTGATYNVFFSTMEQVNGGGFGENRRFHACVQHRCTKYIFM